MILERALQRPDYYSQRELLQSLQRRQRFSPAKAGAPSSLELLREDRGRWATSPSLMIPQQTATVERLADY